ncbi:MAG: hypothetical protein KAR35_03660 [Candidatus Heimdallarchaeota archaeon]|nr:hypothetical protein [Candidatus Heimdallarchaeota archaeon]MCK5048452.1 hypothetical protein [Candidatus Heimdallarchaeota archaeon]
MAKEPAFQISLTEMIIRSIILIFLILSFPFIFITFLFEGTLTFSFWDIITLVWVILLLGFLILNKKILIREAWVDNVGRQNTLLSVIFWGLFLSNSLLLSITEYPLFAHIFYHSFRIGIPLWVLITGLIMINQLIDKGEKIGRINAIYSQFLIDFCMLFFALVIFTLSLILGYELVGSIRDYPF